MGLWAAVSTTRCETVLGKLFVPTRYFQSWQLARGLDVEKES